MRSIHFNNALRNTGGIDVPHLPTDMMLGRSILRVLHEIVHDWSRATDHVTIAVREGKAFDQLQQQLAHVPGVVTITVDESAVSGGKPRERERRVVVIMSEPPPQEAQHLVRYAVMRVNERNGANINVWIVDRKRPKGGEFSLEMKEG